MARKLLRIVCVVLLCITICCAAKDSAHQDNTAQEQPDIEEVYDILNKELFWVNYKNDQSTMQEIYHHAEDVQGDFLPVVNEDSIFP